MMVQTAANPLLEATLNEMAAAFAAEWARRFERPGRAPCASLQGETLVLQLEKVFTPVELDFGRRLEGRSAVRRQIEAELDDLYPWLAEQVESRLQGHVAESRILLDFDAETVQYVMAVHDLPRLPLPQQNVETRPESAAGAPPPPSGTA